MSSVLLIIIAIVEALAAGGVMFTAVAAQRAAARSSLKSIENAAEERKQQLAKSKETIALMSPIDKMLDAMRELLGLQESLKTERGRITITQAELDTVDARLRELEEIERELEASGIETKEELNILKKKEKEMTTKNDLLKNQINDINAKLQAAAAGFQLSGELMTQIDAMKTQLVSTQQKIDDLLLQIEQGNDNYFVLKQRYDALDIEYAQLYEKFAETEGASGGGGD